MQAFNGSLLEVIAQLSRMRPNSFFICLLDQCDAAMNMRLLLAAVSLHDTFHDGHKITVHSSRV
jgi:hypothetical protein